MSSKTVDIGQIWGIPIVVDSSWFLLFALLIALFLPGQDWLTAVIATVLFFVSLLLHELGHTLVALRYGLPVRSIRFSMLGGLTEIGAQPATARQELSIALAGPLVSALIAALFLVLSGLMPTEWKWMVWQAAALGRINLLLTVFNLVPAFPLDGGLALRAVFWMWTGNLERATQHTTVCARGLAFGLILLGVGCVLSERLAIGSLAIVIGWRLKGMLGRSNPVSSPESSAVVAR